MRARYPIAATVLAVLLTLGVSPASAQTAYDPVQITPLRAGHGKVVMRVQAGPSGAPAGFTVWWMRQSEFTAVGAAWPSGPALGKRWAAYVGTPTLNDGGGTFDSFQLGPGEVVEVEVGDLIDETGLYTNALPNAELGSGDEYVFTAFANTNGAIAGSPLSPTEVSTTRPTTDCTYTLGYWKNHPEAWPTASLVIGTVSYTQSQLLNLLSQPARGNGLISLDHQLIAAKLNVLNGANPGTLAGVIAAADALIGGQVPPPIGSGSLLPSATNAYTQALDDFNNGISGPGHCGTTPTAPTTWGHVKTLYR